ncbi:TonB-dependent receptor [Sphingomonas sp. KC8]|uniref:TonB-dependent receptor n=1 Tax=Sphingomonas sp. KC8 TaxID=1030157 RepID=UPI000248A3AC|nr:TonB-dependent receptor [Sphingomonas sp. KC8]ARS29500.1 TonB-dependent receptor [Sphingomonas sp. KC8]
MNRLWISALASTCLCSLSPAYANEAAPVAGAAGGIEDIVVTAQKRAENLQVTPIAITAYTADTLTAMGITAVADVAATTPSLYSAPYPNSPTTIQLYMRGQGTNNPFQITKDGAVGLYLDGFYLSRPQSATMDLADIERIEVLRGPQGTLYGRNTTGGAVNIITKKPTGEMGVSESLTVGNRDHIRSLTNVDLPAIGNLAIKGTFLYSTIDGWTKNAGGEDFGLRQQTAGQIAARWTPADTVTVDYSFDIGRVRSTPLYFSNPDLIGFIPGYTVSRKQTYRPIDLDRSEMNFNGHSLTVEWEASDALTIRSLSGYRRVSSQTIQDYAEVYSTPSANRVTGIRPYDDMETRQYSQELQFVGSIGDRIDYVAGLYYFREKGDHYQDTRTVLAAAGAPAGSVRTQRMIDMLSVSKAAYAQVTWATPLLDDRVSLTGGLRYTRDTRRASRDLSSVFTQPDGTSFNARPPENDITNQQRFSRFNPSVTANFQASDDLMLYAKFSTGYRAGGSDESALFFAETFGPESVTNYEIGVKSDWLDRRLRINLAGFVMDYKEIQLDLPLRRNDPTINQTINAGKARISGFEGDVTIAPIDDLLLTASYAYLHSRIKTVKARAGTILDPAVNPDSGFTVGQNVASRFGQAYAPKHAFSGAVDYTFLRFDGDSGTVVVHANYQWKDAAFASSPVGPAIVGRDYWAIPAYGTLDARLTVNFELKGGDASVALWGRNITDRAYRATVTAIGAPATGYTGQTFAYGEPATYGLEFKFAF